MVKLETKGDKTENRVLVSILSHSYTQTTHKVALNNKFLFLRAREKKIWRICWIYFCEKRKFDLRSNGSNLLHHRSHCSLQTATTLRIVRFFVISFGVFVCSFVRRFVATIRIASILYSFREKTVPGTARHWLIHTSERIMNFNCEKGKNPKTPTLRN